MPQEISIEEYQKKIKKNTGRNDLFKCCLMFFQISGHCVSSLTKSDMLRFGTLKKSIEGITNTMLSSTLKCLEEEGLLIRTQFNEISPHVEYALSTKGKALHPIFLEIMKWAQKYGKE